MSPAQVYIPRIAALTLRLSQLLSSVVVIGIVGHYLDTLNKYHIPAPNGRFVYTAVVSSTSLVYSFLCMVFWKYTVFPVDLGLFVMNLAAFGSVVNWVVNMGCEKTWDVEVKFGTWLSGREKDQCGRWAAVETFTFVSAVLFLASGLLAVWKIWKQGKDEEAVEKPKPWFRCL